MRQHVHEVDHDGGEMVLDEGGDVAHHLFAEFRIDDLDVLQVVAQLDAPALEQFLEEFLLVLVHRIVVIVLARPEVGEDALDFARVVAAENGISRIRRRRRENAHVEVLLDRVHVAQVLLHDQPLVVAHAVDHEEEHRSLRREVGEEEAVDDLRRERHVVVVEPVFVMPLDELAEFLVALFPLVRHGLLQSQPGVLVEFQLPFHQLAVDFHPLLEIERSLQLEGHFVELADVVLRGAVADDALALQDLFRHQQDLARIHRFGEVVADFLPDGLFHQGLFLVFRDHDHGQFWLQLLDGRESL